MSKLLAGEIAPAWIASHGLARRCSSWVTRDGPLATLWTSQGMRCCRAAVTLKRAARRRACWTGHLNLIGQGGGQAEVAHRPHGAGRGEFSPGHGNPSFPWKDPLPALARGPPPSVARLSWRCQDPLLCVPRLLGVCPSREEIFQG